VFLLFGNSGEKFAASLGGNILTVRMPVQETPPAELEQGVAFFQNEEVRYRLYHLVIVGKTSPQVVDNTDFLSNLVQQIGRTVKLSTY
jgi:hypothetical protein